MSAVIFVMLGLIGLVIGGELLVRGAVSAAKTLGISPLVIGLTLVGFGTSTPELVTSLQAAWAGSPGIAIGNVVGSNIGNILLILGLTAMFGTIAVNPAAFKRDGTVLVIATLAVVGLSMLGALGRVAGAGLFAGLIVYLIYTLWSERAKPTEAQPVYEGEAELVGNGGKAMTISAAQAFAGLIITILGARLLVSGAVELAQSAGVSETLIGLTIVAIGTSLPELVTSVMAILRKQGDVAFGNIVGSNIFNMLGILGITALVQPLSIPPEILRLDIWVMLGATALLLVFARTGWRLRRLEGAMLLGGYVIYLGVLIGTAQ